MLQLYISPEHQAFTQLKILKFNNINLRQCFATMFNVFILIQTSTQDTTQQL